jgi:hypothetical protein
VVGIKRWLRMFGLRSSDPATILTAAGVLTMVAVLAALPPALRLPGRSNGRVKARVMGERQSTAALVLPPSKLTHAFTYLASSEHYTGAIRH